MRLGIAAIVSAVLTIVTSVAEAQVDAAAEQAFRDGKRLMAERRFGEACDAFATSQRLEPNIATLMSLADCREKNGQLASAWALFLEAEQITRNQADLQDLHATADERSIRLEPRLSYITINVPDESRLKGLVVYRDGDAVDPGLWNRAVPVDGGNHRIEAKAPGHEPWLTEVAVAAENDRQAVEVPRFKDLPALVKPPTASAPLYPAPPRSEPRPPAREGAFTPRRRLALGIGGASVVALGTTFVLWSKASNLQNDARVICMPSGCTAAEAALANDINDKARERALYGNVALGVGVAAAAAGGYLWLTGAPTSRGIAIIPQLGAVTGIAATGAF